MPSFNQGGSERQAIQLVRLLKQEFSYNVGLACLDRNGVLFEEVNEIGLNHVPEFPLSSFYDLNTAGQIKRFVKYLRSAKTDVVQTHDFYSNIFGMLGAKLAGVPVRIAAKRETGMRSVKQLFIERRAFGLANSVVANSRNVKEYLISSGVPDKKIEVIYNGIDASRFLVAGDRHEIPSDLKIPGHSHLVTIVANLRDPVKDHRTFLQAASSVAGKVDDVGFVIVGEGELIDQTRARAFELGIGDQTYFTGRCTRVPEILAVSDVCVLSSASEGFSNSIIEYMAAGKPVVATNVGGAAEAVVEGETGFLVGKGDSESMAKRIVLLITDKSLAERFGTSGRARVAELFSSAAQLEKTVALYERELSRTRANRQT